MTGLDTNILVRYLTQDDEIQSSIASKIIERQLSTTNPGFVSMVAMVELVWVLDRVYELTSQEIVAAIERMLESEVLVIENEQEVFAAMISLQQGLGSFADTLIAEVGTRAGCTHTLTFDNKASRLPGFRLASFYQ